MRLVVPNGRADGVILVPFIAIPGQATLLAFVWKL